MRGAEWWNWRWDSEPLMQLPVQLFLYRIPATSLFYQPDGEHKRHVQTGADATISAEVKMYLHVAGEEYGKSILSGTTVKSGEAYCIVRLTGINTEIGQGQADIMADRASASVSVFEQKVMVAWPLPSFGFCLFF